MKSQIVITSLLLAVVVLNPTAAIAGPKFELLPTEERWELLSANLKKFPGMTTSELFKLLGRPVQNKPEIAAYEMSDVANTRVTFRFADGKVISIQIVQPQRFCAQ